MCSNYPEVVPTRFDMLELLDLTSTTPPTTQLGVVSVESYLIQPPPTLDDKHSQQLKLAFTVVHFTTSTPPMKLVNPERV